MSTAEPQCPIGFGPIITIVSDVTRISKDGETIPILWRRVPEGCRPKYPVTIKRTRNNLQDLIFEIVIRGITYSFTRLFQNGNYLEECPASQCVTCDVKTNIADSRPIKFIIKITRENTFCSGETFEFNFNTNLEEFVVTYIYPRELGFRSTAQCFNTTPSSMAVVNQINANIDVVKVEIPEIRITAQSDIFGNNLDNVLFEVIDNVRHRTNFPCGTKCRPEDNNTSRKQDNKHNGVCPTSPILIDSKDVIQTNFSEYPNLTVVLKGKGCNLRQKAESIMMHYGIDMQVEQFMINLIEYSTGKYILSRLLWKQFNIKWLLRRYNDKFFEQLRNSRYCRFLTKFDRFGGYERYFKY